MIAGRLPAGRPPGDLAYGVDIGGTKVLGVAVAGGRVAAECRMPTPQLAASAGNGADVVAPLANAISEVISTLAGTVSRGGAAPTPHDGAGVGIGVPGMLDRDGVVRFSPNLPGIVGVALAPLVAGRLGGADVRVANDANCAALAEQRLGAARGVRDGLVVTLGTGIGGAVVVGGEIRSGAHGYAGEVGHMVVDPSGPLCPCGGRGCWEQFASGAGLGRLAREAAVAGTLDAAVALAGGDPDLVRGEHATMAAASGDAGALAVVERFGWWLALGLANLVAICDPEIVVVGGGLAEAGELLLDPARRAYETLVEGGRARPRVPIVAAALGERAGAVGAALMAGATRA